MSGALSLPRSEWTAPRKALARAGSFESASVRPRAVSRQATTGSVSGTPARRATGKAVLMTSPSG